MDWFCRSLPLHGSNFWSRFADLLSKMCGPDLAYTVAAKKYFAYLCSFAPVLLCSFKRVFIVYLFMIILISTTV